MAFSCLSLLMVKPATAQSIPTPSVPEFTLKVVANPIYVPPTTTIDPYTGNVTTQAGYYVQNTSIVITIKNQPFSYSYNGTTYNLYYNVRLKGHFGQDWTELYPVSNVIDSLGESFGNSLYVPSDSPSESNSDYTVLSYVVGANGNYPFTQILPDSQVDFQVEAIVGHVSQVYVPDIYDNAASFVGTYYQVILFDTSSSWSNTATITVVNAANASSTSASTAPNPTATPTLTSMPPQNSTATTRNPTVGIKTKTGAGFNCIELALFTSLAVIAGLVIAVVALVRRNNRKREK